MFVFLIAFSIAIGVPETARLDRPDFLQATFIAFVSAGLFLVYMFLLVQQAADKNRTDWLIVTGYSTVVIAGTGLLIYRYFYVLSNISYSEALAYTCWSAIAICGMTVAVKLGLRLLLGKHYGA